jgi:hypothetical protein
MYKLEFIWINTKENKFFEESDAYDKNKAIEFFKYYLVKHNLATTTIDPKDFPHEIHFNQLPDGSWTKVARVFGFHSPEHVEEYYLDAAKEGLFGYPEIKRQWQQEHDIAAEVNILDAKDNIVKLLSSCHGNICVKYGSCDSNLGCNIKTNLPRYNAKSQFPIFHIKEYKV